MRIYAAQPAFVFFCDNYKMCTATGQLRRRQRVNALDFAFANSFLMPSRERKRTCESCRKYTYVNYSVAVLMTLWPHNSRVETEICVSDSRVTMLTPRLNDTHVCIEAGRHKHHRSRRLGRLAGGAARPHGHRHHSRFVVVLSERNTTQNIDHKIFGNSNQTTPTSSLDALLAVFASCIIF